jgi:hypothetical protein
MHTDYQNLNSFELSVVVFIGVGVLLIGTIAFSSMGIRHQNNFLQALNILDVQAQVAESAASIQTLLSFQQEFYNQFYVAFTQVATLPAETFEVPRKYIQTAYNAFANYSDEIVFDYRIQNSGGLKADYVGRVAGASKVGKTLNKIWSK